MNAHVPDFRLSREFSAQYARAREALGPIDPGFDAALAALIDAGTKRLIIEAYSFGLCSEETAIRLIRENQLVHA